MNNNHTRSKKSIAVANEVRGSTAIMDDVKESTVIMNEVKK